MSSLMAAREGAAQVSGVQRARILAAMARVVAEHGLNGTTVSSSPPELTAEGLVGAVFSVIHARMLQTVANAAIANGSKRPGNAHRTTAATTTTTTMRMRTRTTVMPVGMPLTGLLNPLMAMIVLPYQGQAAAREELAHPTPKTTPAHLPSRVPEESRTNPLQGLNMRLTYRTLLVLAAIATDPGASNRQIADHAGVHDQGQISKLLTRLQRLGLIHNTGPGQAHGEPNAWTLTPHGTAVQHALTTSP